jgi:hypothetical protein
VGIATHESLANFTDVSLLHASFHCAPHPDQSGPQLEASGALGAPEGQEASPLNRPQENFPLSQIAGCRLARLLRALTD